MKYYDYELVVSDELIDFGVCDIIFKVIEAKQVVYAVSGSQVVFIIMPCQ